MKKILLRVLLVVGLLVALFVALVVGVLVVADDQQDIERLSYKVGYAFGMFLVLLLAIAFIFVAYKLVAYALFGDRSKQPPVDKDAPLDRYLK